ncbi:serine/threonine-protein kinase [Leptolyngbya sp. FACHB-671]|uniref:protein kinase domain-containing protein n=1 Tax=Leptolyngbya sp. FACHB-671 TaxID=2692812 RepID=UPI0018EF840E
MSQPAPVSIYCINPDCSQPCQVWGNRFCQRCGSMLQLRGRYLPLQILGSGGFAVTYAVYDSQSRTEKVLKVLVEQAPKARELFEQEAAVLARLNHPGVPKVEPGNYFKVAVERRAIATSQGEANSSGFSQNASPRTISTTIPCLVMEKINGQTLQSILEEHPHGCPETWVVNWFYQALDILQELHAHQIVHRDLKPANLMVRLETGQLVAIDFGGAKQMHTQPVHRSISSTRLVSPGYSPPEQVEGGDIQPSADFYALGRTLIHLLTGRYPVQLEDPITGELRWRNLVQVNPDFADLLDRLVRANPQRRPESTEEVRLQLQKIAPFVAAHGRAAMGLTTPKNPVVAALQKRIKAGKRGIVAIATAILQATVWTFRAVLDTCWSTTLATAGAGIGTTVGFFLAYGSPVGTNLAELLSKQLVRWIPDLALEVEPGFLMFGLAGLGTALGLTAAGGFGQRRRGIVSGFTGILSYLLGWVGLQFASTQGTGTGLAVFVAIAPTLLTLGLGLPSHHLLYAVITAVSLTPFITSLVWLNPPFINDLWQVFSVALPPFAYSNGMSFWACLLFFCLLSLALGSCLGVSHYIFVPCLRRLGWR